MRVASTCMRLLVLCALLSLGCGRESPNRVAGQKSKAKGDEQLITKYPIVLLHGFFGWQQVFHIDYFYQVPKHLRKLGYKVYATQVTPIHTVETRVHQLAPQIDKILAETGAEKVNLIAHSMGGLDARYLISVLGYGDRVASVTSIATPHGGSLIADAMLGVVDAGNEVKAAANSILQGTNHLIQHEMTLPDMGPVDLNGALYNLSTKFANEVLDPMCPDDSRVYYQSWSGAASFRHRFKPDIFDPIVAVAHRFIEKTQGPNDGLVSANSALHGVDRGVVPGDHLDEIGQLLGRAPEGFDHKKFYQGIVEDLASRGY